MWIKVILVISMFVVVTQAERGNGYSYNRPAPIQAALTFYQYVPAGHDPATYITNLQQQQGHHRQQQISNLPRQNYHHHIHPVQSNQLSHEEPSNQYVPPSQPSREPLPFIRENSGLRPIVPSQTYKQPQVEPRTSYQGSYQDEIAYQFPPSQISPFPSHEFTPPPPVHSAHQSESNRGLMASLTNSVNVPLPFPFGVVPIKFDPLPLTTNLRQEKILSLLSSYDVKRLYKKK